MFSLTDKTLIIGPTRCGKTALAMWMLTGWGLPYFLYDTEGEAQGAYTELRRIDWRKKEIVYDAEPEGRADRQGHFSRICRVVQAQGGRVFVCPEIQEYVKTNSVPDALQAIIKRGRHRDIGVMALAQDFTGMGPLIRQCQHLFVFSVCGSDLDQADSYMPETGGKKPSEILPGLRPYQFLYWPRSDQERRGRCYILGPVPFSAAKK